MFTEVQLGVEAQHPADDPVTVALSFIALNPHEVSVNGLMQPRVVWLFSGKIHMKHRAGNIKGSNLSSPRPCSSEGKARGWLISGRHRVLHLPVPRDCAPLDLHLILLWSLLEQTPTNSWTILLCVFSSFPKLLIILRAWGRGVSLNTHISDKERKNTLGKIETPREIVNTFILGTIFSQS